MNSNTRVSGTRSVLLATAAAALLMAGCASTPEEIPALEQARAELETARGDANAQRYASEEVKEAERLLTAADQARESKKDVTEISHLAYLSLQTSRIAREMGKAKSAEERIAAASAERERARLEARTREADAATTAAEEARAAASQARDEARQAQSLAEAASSQLAIEQERRAQAEQEMEGLLAKRSERGLIVTLGDVLFDTGRAELKSGAARQLDTVATFLAQHPERQVLIEGFTDSVGTDAYNEELSEERAEAVRSALLSRGVDTSRVQVEGYGEQFPVATNADSGGRQLNRRVEVVVSNDAEPVAPRARL